MSERSRGGRHGMKKGSSSPLSGSHEKNIPVLSPSNDVSRSFLPSSSHSSSPSLLNDHAKHSWRILITWERRLFLAGNERRKSKFCRCPVSRFHFSFLVTLSLPQFSRIARIFRQQTDYFHPLNRLKSPHDKHLSPRGSTRSMYPTSKVDWY